jgi:hypothetical protein
VAVPRVDQGGEPVARARDRMQVDERGPSSVHRVAKSHACGHSFVQSQHLPKVRRHVAKERQFGRSGVPKNHVHAQISQDVVGDFPNGTQGALRACLVQAADQRLIPFVVATRPCKSCGSKALGGHSASNVTIIDTSLCFVYPSIKPNGERNRSYNDVSSKCRPPSPTLPFDFLHVSFDR